MKILDYKDVHLIPKPSDIEHLDDIDISVDLGNLHLKVPIIASPMKSIVGSRTIEELDRLGGIGILHRFYDTPRDKILAIANISSVCDNFGVAVGLNDLSVYNVIQDANPSIVCVDIANGYLASLCHYVSEIKEYIQKGGYRTLVMAGNVGTFDGAVLLSASGADLIRVGVGTGALCLTKNVTGIYCGQLSSIIDCEGVDAEIVADGGIQYPGDVVKAFAASANVAMIGTLLANVYESDHDGTIYGMASRKLQSEFYKTVRSVEGIEVDAKKVCSLEDFIREFSYGIKASCAYLGKRKLVDVSQEDLNLDD